MKNFIEISFLNENLFMIETKYMNLGISLSLENAINKKKSIKFKRNTFRKYKRKKSKNCNSYTLQAFNK